MNSRRFLAVVPLLLAATLGVTACATQVPSAIVESISEQNTPQSFHFCGGWGCREGKTISFAEAQWREITSPFRKPAQSAEEERSKIAKALGVFERHGALLAGYQNDKPLTDGSLFSKSEGQMDCFDEAANTSNGLGLLARAGLLKFHSVQQPEMRGFEYRRGLRLRHATAVIAENGSGERFAVDSWFYAPGTPPAIVPLEQWIAGWKPKEGLPV